jgi:hypothetical protein
MTPKHVPEPLRPRDLALLLLASRDLAPRQRARDQQADRVGLALKRKVLERITALDPDPAELDTTLADIVEELGQPAGPGQAMAALIRDEWQMACSAPEWVAHLLAEAIDGER